MLVLSRKVGERIRVGEEVYVTVVKIMANSVRIGIDAPRDHEIVRTEIDVPIADAEQLIHQPAA